MSAEVDALRTEINTRLKSIDDNILEMSKDISSLVTEMKNHNDNDEKIHAEFRQSMKQYYEKDKPENDKNTSFRQKLTYHFGVIWVAIVGVVTKLFLDGK